MVVWAHEPQLIQLDDRPALQQIATLQLKFVLSTIPWLPISPHPIQKLPGNKENSWHMLAHQLSWIHWTKFGGVGPKRTTQLSNHWCVPCWHCARWIRWDVAHLSAGAMATGAVAAVSTAAWGLLSSCSMLLGLNMGFVVPYCGWSGRSSCYVIFPITAVRE